MENKLVSIISPCYNGAEYLRPFLASILSQTYRPIELIFIDDGSTDDTKNVLFEYKNCFDKDGISLIYVYQENQGQAAAINTGLPLFSGDYLMWCDSDDILLPHNIEKKVAFLEENLDRGFVISKGSIVNSEDIESVQGFLTREIASEQDANHRQLFVDLLNENNVIFVPATIMAKRECIYKCIPTLHIYEGRQGQNYQLMLPLAYMFEYGYIDECLFKYVIHNDSHSHVKRKYRDLLERNNEFCKLLISTLQRIPGMSVDEKKRYIDMVQKKYARRNIELALCCNQVFDVYKFKRLLSILGEDTEQYGYWRFIGKGMKRRVRGLVRKQQILELI